MLPFILGALATGGAIWNNERNIQQARRTEAFQERMSSTAAQRSAADYRAAGLNPALAYDRTASSPGGATAQLGDVIGPGINNAMRAREVSMALQVAEQQRDKLQAETAKTKIEGANAVRTGDLLDQQFKALAIRQPIDQRMAAAQAALHELELPGARNNAELARRMGIYQPLIGTARDAADIIARIIPKPRVTITRNFPSTRTTIIKPPR